MEVRESDAADWEALRRLRRRVLADAPLADIGLARIFAEPDPPGRTHLVSMWVDPGHRRRGWPAP
jgi:hypothetical protein